MIVGAFKERRLQKENKKAHLLKAPQFDFTSNESFFGGVKQGINNTCGDGMVIYSSCP